MADAAFDFGGTDFMSSLDLDRVDLNSLMEGLPSDFLSDIGGEAFGTNWAEEDSSSDSSSPLHSPSDSSSPASTASSALHSPTLSETDAEPLSQTPVFSGIRFPAPGRAAETPTPNVVLVLPPTPVPPRPPPTPAYPAIRPKAEPLHSRCASPPLVTVKAERPPSAAPSLPAADASGFVLKREQRKIRNREAAQLSRQRRKEQTEEMGQQLGQSRQENEALRLENRQLKAQIAALQAENSQLREASFAPPSLGAKRRLLATRPVAKAAVVGLMALFGLFTFNVPGIISFAPQRLDAGTEMAGTAELAAIPHFPGRTLMGIDEDSLRDRIARLHSAMREKRSSGSGGNWTLSEADCRRLNVNQTESRRLAEELSLWMEMHEEFREFKRKPPPKRKAKAKRVARKRSDARREADLKSLQLPGLDYWPENTIPPNGGLPEHGELSMYTSSERRYIQRLREALRKRDDTFYLVSFRKDYLLLPATSRNSTGLPRMSLIVPVMASSNASAPGSVPMMQIECEVTGTGLVHLPTSLLQNPNQRPAHNASSQNP